ncbi:MAG TPA: hypothetical protein PKW63_09315, partial [Vicinamibacterales bacterium]|nr:hypothetical protein [Vicinamibacterales bacterium]
RPVIRRGPEAVLNECGIDKVIEPQSLDYRRDGLVRFPLDCEHFESAAGKPRTQQAKNLQA